MDYSNNEREAIQLLSEVASELPDDEFEEAYERLKELKETDPYFIINADGDKYKVKTEHAFLELERMRKNDILKSSVNKQVKVKGLVCDVKMYNNTALFCLSPCKINGEDIGHTWVRYSPSFKGIKFGSTVLFYSEIKKYGDLNNKSGVNWQEIAYVKITGGDNSPLHRIPFSIYNIEYAEGHFSQTDAYFSYEMEVGQYPKEIIYSPEGRNSFSYRRLRFADYQGVKISYHTLTRELVFNSKYKIITSKETKLAIDKLLLFEWMTKLEDWEFWAYTNNR